MTFYTVGIFFKWREWVSCYLIGFFKPHCNLDPDKVWLPVHLILFPELEEVEQDSSLAKMSSSSCNIRFILEKAASLEVTLKPDPTIEESGITSTFEPCEENLVL